MTDLREPAPAKINLCLFLGPVRADGRHELLTLFDSVTLFDELVMGVAGRDQVICPGVIGPNLVSEALGALRAAGWNGPPVTVEVVKRIPVAAGLGGGSADAAALLRLAQRLVPVDPDVIGRIAAGLGADVPAQLDPGPSIGTGAGDVVEPLSGLPPYGVLILPGSGGLSTPAVYAEADRLGLGRSRGELRGLRRQLTTELAGRLIVNDLEPAAVSLAPAIAPALSAAGEAGADHALVCGSGPTVIGVFRGGDGPARAGAAATALRERFPGATAAAPVARGDRGWTANE